ncbi:hypothetical protein E0L93_12570 [Rubrobacter taiwanensis]|jgi:hypothetical protein|uniref:Uncharacterized protein n=1 Tax=Rubrobacter taiwanensis TaxID=185139 RepID=A0A4R1BEQ1_9ACTN|nr:hypothetical protein [Rubrobacter taiwanensis]TCJ15645.1 hypothetical protein E0L93_12570 [Rubrobacter taiwanensis]
MRVFALMFAFIALTLLVQFVLYLIIGPVDWRIAALIFGGFVACLLPALLLLKPFERPPEVEKRIEERRRRARERFRGSGS